MSLKVQKQLQKTVQENISSFIDDELDSVEQDGLINHLHENEEQKRVLDRYCVMSGAIKRTLPDSIKHDLLGRVQLALASEPALLAPAPSHIKNELPEAEIVKFPVKTRTFKPVFGFGIAASVALAVVLGFQMSTPTSDLPNQPIAAVNVINAEPATQQMNILIAPVDSVGIGAIVVNDSQNDATYAEQSLINDGQWTRITQVAGIPLRNNIFSGRAESHVQFRFQDENFPLRSVKH